MRFIKGKYLSAVYIILLVSPCGRETNVYDLKQLQYVYAQSIRFPIESAAAVINMPIETCGNTSDAEYREMFVPNLFSEPYATAVRIRYPTILVLRPEEDSLVPENRKVLLVDFFGYRSGKDSVLVTEDYRASRQSWQLKKLCVYKNSEWKVHVIEKSVNGEKESELIKAFE